MPPLPPMPASTLLLHCTYQAVVSLWDLSASFLFLTLVMLWPVSTSTAIPSCTNSLSWFLPSLAHIFPFNTLYPFLSPVANVDHCLKS
ncbi:hypothetical protein DFH07DRAFT_830378 [Mycena maculata]|uniref:Uncharacterized protein n=1 Tax=Mycena maculata TaxID=230809 RepID=A0AAD7N6P1_9AGAR|nr:hypothetical protein DFH07DRAFT_830378 [Mycena maculata]